MAGSLFSGSWYRVERLKPRLRSHVQLLRHQYRGQTWYVLQDHASDRFHRFSPAAYFVIGLMDGRRTVGLIWESATAELGDDAPTQDEVIRLLSQLHAGDLIVCDVPPDTVELTRRADERAKRKLKTQLMSVFAWKFALFDPDRFLTVVAPFVRPFLGRIGFLLWLLIVGFGIVLGVTHWPELTHDLLDHVFAPQNLLILWLVFPVIKLLHEFGHGVATKAFGGEVHELGMMLLVFTPIPYVEASASWAFRSKWQRIVVGAAGMMTEAVLATMAMVVWIGAEPGLVKMIAYNTIVIAGVSTVLFNANPLLRFDGYYMLMDYLEIPNLKTRSTEYLRYLCERYLYKQPDVERPVATSGERAWFVGYGIASSVYRMLVVIGILLFLGEKLPILALTFAGIVGVTMIGIPLMKGLSYLLTDPRLQPVRTRAIGVTAAVVAGIVVVLCAIPAPFHTLSEGVVWLPDEAFVRAGSDGFIERVVAIPGSRVKVGDILVICNNPELAAKVRELTGRVKELEARYTEQRPKDLVKAAIIAEELRYATEDLREARRRAGDLVVKSQANGLFIVPKIEDLPGRYLHQGELIGHVVELDAVTVRTVVAQSDIDLISDRRERIEVQLAEQIGHPIKATLLRAVPSALDVLPSAALGTQGGGSIPVDPTDTKGLKSLQKFFQLDLTVPGETGVVNAGGRVYVRFSHDWTPLSRQWYRQVRQLFLSRFDV